MSGRELPPFPTDDFTLDQLKHALDTCRGDGGLLVGGEFTLSQFLAFMSGHDPERATFVGYGDLAGIGNDIPIYESWDQQYSEHDVIRALIARIRELEKR